MSKKKDPCELRKQGYGGGKEQRHHMHAVHAHVCTQTHTHVRTHINFLLIVNVWADRWYVSEPKLNSNSYLPFYDSPWKAER